MSNDLEKGRAFIHQHKAGGVPACRHKSQFLAEAGVPRSTLYQLFKKKNPTIQTLAKIIHTAYKGIQKPG
jgi:predicted transcriptional regulator